MNDLDIQRVIDAENLPTDAQLQLWVDSVLTNADEDYEIVIRIVDEAESAILNETYRGKTGATNILSFPADLPDEVDLDLLGDLVVCAPVLAQEALEQHKALDNHWAHIIIHGVLHLLGYDHIDDAQADEMENKEIAILQTLQIPNPYRVDDE
jgi:probable rRNA maturation factor